MNFKVKKELKEFLLFKKDYKFVEKNFVEEEGKVFCDGFLLKDEEEKITSETDNWVNIGFKLNSPSSKVLSNLFPYEFKFRGKKLSSIESFFQGIKFKDKKIQNYVFKYYGTNAVHIKNCNECNWQENQILYWQGNGINRYSKEYENLIDELYISAIQNPLYKNALINCNKYILHSIGKEKKEETVFTRKEFEYELNCLKEFVKIK